MTNIERRVGGSHFLNKDAHLVVPYIVDEIAKRSGNKNREMWVKSNHIYEDYEQRIKAEQPEMYAKGRTYIKQTISKNLTMFGFERCNTNYKNSPFFLKW